MKQSQSEKKIENWFFLFEEKNHLWRKNNKVFRAWILLSYSPDRWSALSWRVCIFLVWCFSTVFLGNFRISLSEQNNQQDEKVWEVIFIKLHRNGARIHLSTKNNILPILNAQTLQQAHKNTWFATLRFGVQKFPLDP